MDAPAQKQNMKTRMSDAGSSRLTAGDATPSLGSRPHAVDYGRRSAQSSTEFRRGNLAHSNAPAAVKRQGNNQHNGHAHSHDPSHLHRRSTTSHVSSPAPSSSIIKRQDPLVLPDKPTDRRGDDVHAGPSSSPPRIRSLNAAPTARFETPLRHLATKRFQLDQHRRQRDVPQAVVSPSREDFVGIGAIFGSQTHGHSGHGGVHYPTKIDLD